MRGPTGHDREWRRDEAERAAEEDSQHGQRDERQDQDIDDHADDRDLPHHVEDEWRDKDLRGQTGRDGAAHAKEVGYPAELVLDRPGQEDEPDRGQE